MSNASVQCVVAFLALHTIGGRYTYWDVPYDAWSQALFGRSIGDSFGFTRNMYDRFVHFAFGLLLLRPAWEALRVYGRVEPRLAAWLALAIVTSFSAAYEMFEWLLTLFIAGPMADDYNGQQGDIWDAQKDMALALLGALIGAVALRLTACRPSSAAGSPGSVASG